MASYIRRYLRSLKIRIETIARDSRFSDKVRLMSFNLFDSISRRRFPLLKRYISVIKESLVKGVVVNFKGNKFYCIDGEDL